MKYGNAAPELAATGNISAFNIANALGGVIGGAVVDSSLGAGAIPFAAAVIPLAALVFILTQERGHGVGSVQTLVAANPAGLGALAPRGQAEGDR